MNTTPFTSTYTYLHRIVDSFECHWYSSFPRRLLMGAAKRTAITVSLFLTPLTLGVDVARALFHPGTAANRIHIIKNTTIKHLALMVSFVFFTTFGFGGAAMLSLLLKGISTTSLAIPLFDPFAVAATATWTFLFYHQTYRDVVNDPHLPGSRNFSIFRPNPPSTNQSQNHAPRINQRTPPVYRLQPNNALSTRTPENTTFQLRLMIQGHLQTLSGFYPEANLSDPNLIQELEKMITKSLRTITSQTLEEEKDTIKTIITSHIESISKSSTTLEFNLDNLQKLYSTILSELDSLPQLKDLLADIEDPSMVFDHLETLNALLVMKTLFDAPDPIAFLNSLCEKGESESNKKFSDERTTTLIKLVESTQKYTEIQKQELITAICKRDTSNKTAKGILAVAGHFLTGYRILSDALVAAAQCHQLKQS